MSSSISGRRAPSVVSAAILAAAVVGAAALVPLARGEAFETAHLLPPPAVDVAAGGALQTAIFSGGCFWGVQGVFEHVRGVRAAVSGYSGGDAHTAQYETVSTGVTGHAESVKVVFDPREVTYGQLLRIFFSVATDPTQVNRQYPDEGTQYRSEIFYTTREQQKAAKAYIAQLDAAKAFSRKIATRVDPAGGFYMAEHYHQDYLTLHPDQPYIATYDLPKVEALRRLFPAQYRPDPVRVFKAG